MSSHKNRAKNESDAVMVSWMAHRKTCVTTAPSITDPNSSTSTAKVANASIASVATEDSVTLFKNNKPPTMSSVAVAVSSTLPVNANELDTSSVAVTDSAICGA